MKTEEQKKREQRKHFWIGVTKTLAILLASFALGYVLGKMLISQII